MISSKNPTELQHGEGRVEESGLRPGASPQRNLTTRGKESRGTPQALALCMFAAFATEVTHGLRKGWSQLTELPRVPTKRPSPVLELTLG